MNIMKPTTLSFIWLLIFLTLICTNILLFPLNTISADCSGSSSDGTKTLCDPLGNQNNTNNIQTLIGTIIKAVLGVVGSLALVMFIYGGLLWMTAAGNTERVEKGKKTIVWAVLGLVVIFTSYALVKFILLAIGVQDK